MAAPLVQFDGAGSAAILSYNVPQSVSKSGRNYISLEIPQSYFSKSTPQVGTNLLSNPQIVELNRGSPEMQPARLRSVAAQLATNNEALITDRGLVQIVVPGSEADTTLRMLPDNTVRLDPIEAQQM